MSGGWNFCVNCGSDIPDGELLCKPCANKKKEKDGKEKTIFQGIREFLEENPE